MENLLELLNNFEPGDLLQATTLAVSVNFIVGTAKRYISNKLWLIVIAYISALLLVTGALLVTDVYDTSNIVFKSLFVALIVATQSITQYNIVRAIKKEKYLY